MLLVKVRLKPSPLHGIGCFAEESIPEGQLVWVFDERIDLRISASDLGRLPAPVRDFLGTYGYVEIYEGRKTVVLCGDHSRHMNHSDHPNLLNMGERDVAARDIERGEELTCNYYEFDLEAATKLSRENTKEQNDR